MEESRRQIELGACRVQLYEWAPPSGEAGPPILLLHGWPQSAAMWRRLGPKLAAFGRRVFAPDLRGFGASESPGFGHTSRDFARDQVALLRQLGAPRVDLIGHDWGGWTAFTLALAHPDRLNRALVISSPHPWCRLTPSRLSGAWRLWYAAANAAPGLGPRLNRSPAYIERILGAAVEPQARRAYAAELSAPGRAPVVAALYRHYFGCLWNLARGAWRGQRVEIPLHLLFGGRDHLIPAAILDPAELAAGAPQASLEILPGAGHFLVDEQPELVLDRAVSLFGLAEQATQ